MIRFIGLLAFVISQFLAIALPAGVKFFL